MPQHSTPKKKSPELLAGSLFLLKIRLLDVSPMIWRRVLVPAAYTLEELHGVIQVAMGWESIHLYHFSLRAVEFGSWELGARDPGVSLESFQFRKGAKFTYIYDLNAFWRHEIRVEDCRVPKPGQFYPRCVDSARSGPPEDCGGPEGYAEFLLDGGGAESMRDLAVLVDMVRSIALEGKDELLKDQAKREELQGVLERIEERRIFQDDAFCRATINARLAQDEHHILMCQQC